VGKTCGLLFKTKAGKDQPIDPTPVPLACRQPMAMPALPLTSSADHQGKAILL
jgi:hypothetical protein